MMENEAWLYLSMENWRHRACKESEFPGQKEHRAKCPSINVLMGDSSIVAVLRPQRASHTTACDKLKNLPIIILANKQDIQFAASPENIAAAFGIPELSRHNKITVLPLEMPPESDEVNKSVLRVKKIVTNICFGK
ncbi:ADP-ribosylation factor-like protein 3 [Caerostris extrusa]|uniref:ADP-ribosylation factor-like protein 3 n=1 Tax=Caerostris extrusa TaxID=172846 RepID=A0AAV4P924_CAEEX|nr:ADP-ribosylation factor-like protein 3 [Caerostris extrusa]